jgi:predicted alpha/beta superfamily hydrolase
MNDYGYAIGGSSLGGLISCYAVYKRPTVFRVGICMSSSFWWNNEDFNNAVITNYYNTNTVLYLDSGDSGPSEDSKNQTIRVRDHFLKIGYNKNENLTNLYYYLDKGGQHNEYYWGKRFSIPLQYLYGN